MPGSPHRLVIATRNAKKGSELRSLLEPHGIHVESLLDLQPLPEVIEDGDTFAENAAKKAVQIARCLNCWVVGEDSGLEVDALDGAPGVYSARFSGENADDDSNNALLIDKLHNTPDDRRTARYVCHVAVADPNGALTLSLERYCRGRITRQARGTNGFGYDPYFLIPEYHRTFGELSALVKRQLSHRGRALRALLPELLKLL